MGSDDDREAGAGWGPRTRGAPEARFGGRAPGAGTGGALWGPDPGRFGREADSGPTPGGAPAPRYRYAIRVEGHLDTYWSEWLEGMTITLEEGGVTRLEGPVIDQAALHGLLSKLRDLRLTIVTLERLGRGTPRLQRPRNRPRVLFDARHATPAARSEEHHMSQVWLITGVYPWERGS